ncbi:MAG: hypothetical protein HS111_15025 [Kofleriaceae bacterium]|nr:hypothetical protein [Kofleriaceae bacterium]MCL4225418.1 hypothetical protein [Myxococcales bacterium]
MRRAAISAATLLLAGACQDGTIEVVLVQPVVETARPSPATTAVLRLAGDGAEVLRSGAVEDGRIDFGEVPVGRYDWASVELRDVSNGLVGFGKIAADVAVEPAGGATITIPIRRPRLLGVGPAPSRGSGPDDPVAPLEAASITTVQLDVSGGPSPALMRAAPAATRVTAAAGPDQFVAAGSVIHRLDTSSDEFLASALTDVGQPILDLAGSGDGRWLAAGTAGGLFLVEIAAPAPRHFLMGQRVDAVAFSVDADGTGVAVALIDAARSVAQCPRASRLVVVRPTEPETAGRELDPGGGVADIAGSPTRPRVVAAGVCGNRSLLIGLDPDRVIATETTVTAPTAATALADRAWIAGVRPGVVQPVPDTNGAELYTAVGAIPELVGFDLVTDAGTRFDLPQLSETMYTRDDTISSISQTTNAKAAAVQGLTVTPTGDQLALAVTELYNHPPLVISAGILGRFDVIPPIVLHGSRLLVVSTRTSRVEQVVRTRCKVCMEPSNELGTGCTAASSWLYADWVCVSPPGLLEPVTDLELGGVSAIYGAP